MIHPEVPTFVPPAAAFVSCVNATLLIPPCAIPQSPIHVFTSYTTDSPDRLGMSRKVRNQQESYCKNKGYEYSAFERNLALQNPSDPFPLPFWSKIAGINQLLEKDSKTEWIVWLDDDAVVMNPNIDMKQFIQDHGGLDLNTHVIVTKDVHGAATDLNTGVLLVRNSDISRQFFRDLWAVRDQPIAGQGYSYSNCANQLCLHEQQAMHDLLKNPDQFNKPDYKKYVKIIPQRDENGVGINTFERSSHFDHGRNMQLNYNDPLGSKCNKEKDFVCQCTGLAAKGQRPGDSGIKNLREVCIDELIQSAQKIVSA